ncbi:MAG: hypothetical protein QOJ81_1538 [Chloroflexota bacterium]|jgi:hypothetical protein|nr:hypothetical protein [Chloroflexota bacterium]
MLSMLVHWDATGAIVHTNDYMIAFDENSAVIGLIDFAAHEAAGGRMRDIVYDPGAVGAGTWPEWLGGRAHEFKVELDPNPGQARARIKALVHRTSGHRRVRASVDAAIAERINEKRLEATRLGEDRRKELRRLKVSQSVIEEAVDPEPEPADLRDIVGGPGKPLLLDADGKTMARPKVERPNLPIVRR